LPTKREIYYFQYNLFITFAVVLDISSSLSCCYQLYEPSFSYYAPNEHQK
jgi:hypothetical protein